uniref:Uncharacterized protein n=1 Tax=Equus asinus asinus TaxID=83772 RepID=A0A8C4LBY5_EQUAS
MKNKKDYKYCGYLYTKKLNKLDEMDKFLEIHGLLRLNHEEVENLSRPITRKKIELGIKNFSTKKMRTALS